MFLINPYKPKSKGARRLAKAVGGRVYRKGDHVGNNLVINWGDGNCPLPQVLNQASAVRLVANKRTAFDALSSASVPIPRYAKTKGDVTWKGTTVVRNKLTGHSGEGIEIHEPGGTLPDAPLYVEYIKKEQEFRIHVGRVNGETKIIAVQRKARNRSIPDSEVDWKVRNHDNGFVFARSDANPDDAVLEAACMALTATGLDFGAVDIIWNGKERKAYVLEINTAPGIEGTTIEDYANFFREFS